MSRNAISDTGEAAILVRVFDVGRGKLAPEAARYFLHMDFPPNDQHRMDSLAHKALQGSLTVDEQEELEHYCHVGDLLALMKSKGRLVLKEGQSKG
jgi:hypothetical protein